MVNGWKDVYVAGKDQLAKWRARELSEVNLILITSQPGGAQEPQKSDLNSSESI